MEVQANVQYKIDISADWIKHTGTKALTSSTLTFSIEENTTYEEREGKITVKPQQSGVSEQVIVVTQEPASGPRAVDLGLSVKWSSCNVGANIPEEVGGYFAWGETESKNVIPDGTYKWSAGPGLGYTKYVIDAQYGTVDNKPVLEPEDDAAHVNLGGNWRMPTKEEWDELVAGCTWTWTKLNGFDGYDVVSKNGNKIFIRTTSVVGPYGLDDELVDWGGYWTASLNQDASGSCYAVVMAFNSDDVCSTGPECRELGYPVRAVIE